jgi:hypothetical protein
MPRDLKTLMPPPLVDHHCTECGALVPPEFHSCDELFMSLLHLAYLARPLLTPLGMAQVGLPEGNPLARLFVDTFGMQHPARSGKSAKSYAAHLTGLCCGVEYGGAQSVYSVLQKWLNGSVEAIGIVRPTAPEFRGTLTVRYVYDAANDAELAARVHEWARDVWEAYSSQHELVRGWMKRALRPQRADT